MVGSSSRRVVAVLSAFALALSLLVGFAATSSAQPREEPLRPPSGPAGETRELADRERGGPEPKGVGDGGDADPVEVAAETYRRVYPRMDRQQALEAAKGQEARKALYRRLLAERQREFGGAWFDPPTGILHVTVTTGDLGMAVAELAEELDVTVRVEEVAYPFTELQDVAERLRGSKTRLAAAARGDIGIDVHTNRVVAAVPGNLVDELRSPDERIVVAAAEGPDAEPDVCNARNDCDDSVRAGSILWRSGVGDWCSAGITGRSTATNRRYVITAGHCSNGNGVTWGTGAGTIGTMAFSADSGDLDAGAVRATQWPYTWQPGGDIYMHLMARRRIDMDGVAPTQSFIWVGDVVCLAANYTNPTAAGEPLRCGRRERRRLRAGDDPGRGRRRVRRRQRRRVVLARLGVPLRLRDPQPIRHRVQRLGRW